MPNYYNPNNFFPATYMNAYSGMYPQTVQPQMMQPGMSGGQSSTGQYMISVDGEGSARAWQPMQQVGPNTIIPLWDLDGQHVYFKSTDAYGRLNPIRKGRVVFEDEQQMLPQNQSGAVQPVQQPAQPMIDPNQFVTKQDFEALKQDLRNMIGQNQPNRNNQNGRQNDQNANRGENK